MKKFILFIICFVFSAFLQSHLHAESVRSYESQHKQKETTDKISEFLKIFDKGMEEDPETQGFRFRMNSNFWSPFNYDIFSATISERSKLVVVRLEGDTGDIFTIARILEKENILKPGSTDPIHVATPSKLDTKYHIYSQSLNIVAPWLSVLHASWNSPRLTKGQTAFRFTAYLLFDGLMVWAGGTNFWQEPFNAKKHNAKILGALILPRLIGSVQHANLIRGHNQVAKLGYTFYLK